MKNINVQKFIISIMNTNDIKFLKELERQVDVFIDKQEQILLLNDTIVDVLDIRDAIILRQTQLKRKELLSAYLHTKPDPIEYTCGCINTSFCTAHKLLVERKQILKGEIKRIDKVLDSREMM